MTKLSFLACLLLGACVADAQNPTAKEWPETGKTVTYDLEITEFDWEVAPGAIYQAVGYNGEIPGPILQANAGDRILIHLKNSTATPHSIHTHISRYPVEFDGVTQGVAQPGESITVEWLASFAGTFPYHDHAGDSGENGGLTAGLLGAVVIHDPSARRAKVENVVVLMDFDRSRYKGLPGEAIGEFAATPGEYKGPHGYMHGINGRTYEAFTPRFGAAVGDIVRWRVLSLGREFHTFHVHGHRWVGADGVLTDNIALGPGMYATFDWREDAVGSWMYHCHVAEHMEGGMMGYYDVAP